MTLTAMQVAMIRKLLNVASELQGHRRYLVDRRHELLDKQREQSRALVQAQRKLEGASHAAGYPIGAERDPLTSQEQAVATAKLVLDRTNADLKALDQRIAAASTDAGQASAVADRILEHEGLNEDLQPVARKHRSPSWS